MSRNDSFGIDFGTTNSSAVRLQATSRQRMFHEYGEKQRPIPSVVAIDRKTGEVHTGRDAWSRREELYRTCECVASIKSVLDDAGWSTTVAGREWRAADIASRVFDAIKRATNQDMKVATVAIPVGFGSRARKVLREAAGSVGIEIESFVSESTAAFFASYEELRGAENVAVFDWGGGTLDVSVIRHSRGMITELSTAGMSMAGDHIDELIARRVHAEAARKNDFDVPFDDMPAEDRDALLVRSERAKIALGSKSSALVRLMKYGDMGLLSLTVSDEWLEDIVSPIVDQAMACLDKALQQAGVSDRGVDRVVLVGGSSNLTQLRRRMGERFGDKLFSPDAPEWSISKGASMLSRTPGAYVSAQNVSIILSNGMPYYLLRKGEAVGGAAKHAEFGVTDTTEMVRVVFSGSRDIDADECRFQIREVPGYGFLEERFRLEWFVDENLVFRVKMGSNMMPVQEVWEYDRLKLAYDLNGGAR